MVGLSHADIDDYMRLVSPVLHDHSKSKWKGDMMQVIDYMRKWNNITPSLIMVGSCAYSDN